MVRRATVGRKQPGARSFCLGLAGQPNGGDPLKQRVLQPPLPHGESGGGSEQMCRIGHSNRHLPHPSTVTPTPSTVTPTPSTVTPTPIISPQGIY